MKVLLSAYACEPSLGSEPGVGWNLARHLAQHHQVWVLTRVNNRHVIEAELAKNPVHGLCFIYHDLPRWARFWKRGQRGVQLYYYLWQLFAVPLVRRLHREVSFDVVQHVTFVKYWAPSALAFVKNVPFVWGPVGGGESAPIAFWKTLGLKGFLYEVARYLAQAIGELDPLVRLTARRATLALATTSETAARLIRLGSRRVQVFSQIGLSKKEIEALSEVPAPRDEPLRLLSVGRLLAWKGFHLGIMAFAQCGLEDAEYWIVGDGPERKRLMALARKLGLEKRIRFFGKRHREEVVRLLGDVDALVHPSLHESGGFVCLEAMAAGRPVICLNLGGPGMQVTHATGFKVDAFSPNQAVSDIAKAMHCLAVDGNKRQKMGGDGKSLVGKSFAWDKRIRDIETLLANAYELWRLSK